jgi:hypothetical protein
MSAIDSAHPQKVADMHRIRWPTCSGFTGRHQPDSVADMRRNLWPTWTGLRTRKEKLKKMGVYVRWNCETKAFEMTTEENQKPLCECQ